MSETEIKAIHTEMGTQKLDGSKNHPWMKKMGTYLVDAATEFVQLAREHQRLHADDSNPVYIDMDGIICVLNLQELAATVTYKRESQKISATAIANAISETVGDERLKVEIKEKEKPTSS